MKKRTGCIFGFLVTVCCVLQSPAEVILDPLGNPVSETLSAFQSVDSVSSVIVVFREEAVTKTKDGKSARDKAGFKKIKLQKKLHKAIGKTRSAGSGQAKKDKSGKVRSKAARNLDNMYVAEVADGASLGDALSELNQSPLVEYAEPNWPIQIMSLPNDPYFEIEQWSLNNTGQTYHTTKLGPESGTPGADIDWLKAYTNATIFPTNEIIIAVIDTGVDYTHRDLTNQMWINVDEIPGNGIDDDNNGYPDDVYGYDFFNTDSNPVDDHSHGTHVSGTIAAEANDNYGIAGICPSAKIMAIKIFNDEGKGNTSDGVPAIRYAADNGAKVINNSWGGGAYQQSLQDAITYANEQGSVVMCASGNNGAYLGSYPASYRWSVSVGATDSDDQRAEFSNYGPWVDVMAPGKDILSDLASAVSYPNALDGEWMVQSGTSMATPTASGAMGLLVSRFPGFSTWIYEKVMEATCNADIYSIPYNTNYLGGLGAGRIDVDDALSYNETNAFLSSYVDLSAAFAFLIPGETTNLIMKAGTWQYPVTNLSITVTPLTAEAQVSTNFYYIGDMAGQSEVFIPDATFQVGTTTNAEWGSVHTFRVELKSGGTVLETKTNRLTILQANVENVLPYDLDNDGVKEIIAAAGGLLTAYRPDGTMIWFHDFGNGNFIYEGAGVGDIDGDGKGEIAVVVEAVNVVVNDTYLYVIEENGTFNTNIWPKNLETEGVSTEGMFFNGTRTPALMDVDGDGALEVVLQADAGTRSRYAVYNAAGTRLSLETPAVTNRMSSPLAVGDLDGDGTNEIVSIVRDEVADRSWFTVRDDTLNELYSVEIAPGTKSQFGSTTVAPVCADLDRDGRKDFLAVGHIDDLDYLVAYNQFGDPLPGFPAFVGGFESRDIPSVADVDGDGDLEVFVLRKASAKVLCFDHEGKTLPGFPLADTNLSGFSQAVMVGNVDGDESPEMLYVGNYVLDESDYTFTYQIFARDMDGLMVQGFPLTINGGDKPSEVKFRLVVDHLPGDELGTNVVIYSSTGGKLNIINIDQPFSPDQQHWPMRSHDAQNTYHYEQVPGKLTGGFSCEDRVGINAYTANFQGAHYASNSASVYYRWDFNDDGTIDAEGTNLTDTNHYYSVPGTYSVRLTLSNSAGEVFSTVSENYITVVGDLSAEFSASPTGDLTGPVGVQFTDTSGDAPQTWNWTFGDGGTSTEQHPMHVYTNVGTYSVTLTVSNDFGSGGSGTDSITHMDLINIIGTASATTQYISPNGNHIYPYKSWADAATNLHSVVSAIGDGHTLIVTNGTYYMDPGQRWFLSASNLTVRSVNGPEVTILDGSRSAEYGVRIQGHHSSIEGFTVQNCNSYGYALGVSGVDSGNATARNMIVKNNFRTAYAGIVHLSKGALLDSLVISNQCYSSAGVEIRFASTVSNCVFRWNESISGAIVGISEGSTLYNSLVANNICGNSAVEVQYINGGNSIYNTTIAYNQITETGGALYVENIEAKLRNVISYYNTGGNYYFEDDNTVAASSCCWTPSAPDISENLNEIIADPRFVNGSGGNFRLASDSPCIDQGDGLFTYPGILHEVLVDFGGSSFGYPSSGAWNNITTTNAGLKLSNLINTNWVGTGIDLVFMTNFSEIVKGSYFLDPDWPFPPSATKDLFGFDEGYVSGKHNLIQLNGLSTNSPYQMGFYAQREGDIYDSATYTVGSVDAPHVYARAGAPHYAELDELVWFSSTSGVIEVDQGGGTIAPLGILKILEHDPASKMSPMDTQFDLDGNDRIFNGQVDLGAYEYSTNSLPVVELLADEVSGVSPLTVSFTAAVWDDQNAITNFHWDFGDGTTTNGASLSNVVHIYSSGSYVATVTVSDDIGQSGVDTLGIFANPRPLAPENFVGINESFTNNALSWDDIADNESSYRLERRAITNHVTLIVDDDAGLPEVDYYNSSYPWTERTLSDAYGGRYHRRYWPSGTQGDISDFSTADYTPNIEEEGWYEVSEWHPTDSRFSPNLAIKINYKNGSEDLYYSQRVNPGQWNTLGIWYMDETSHVTISPFGDANWVAADAMKFRRVEPYEWVATLAPNTTNYNDTGLSDDVEYEYRLASSNSYGLSEWVTSIVQIPPDDEFPVAEIVSVTPTSGIPNLAVTAIGSATDADGTVTNYLWNFGDGYAGSIQSGADLTNASYVYRNIGFYDITLTVFDDLGYASSTVTNSVNVYGAVPNAPSGVQAQNVGDLYVGVTWTDNAYNEELFRLQRQADGGAFSDLTTLGEAAESYDDTNVAFATTYSYRVRTENANGTSDWSNVGSVLFGDEANFTLPFAEPFEPTNITTGAIAGQHGWSGGGTVQAGTVQSGSQALALTGETASHTFLGTPTNIWVEFWSQPVRNETPMEDIPSEASAVFYVNTNDQLVAYDFTNATSITSPTVSNGWNKFGVECDYSSKVWNLELNDELVVSNFAFYGSPASFTAIEITEASTNIAFIDSIEITDSLDDSDGDGLPDWWEDIYFGDLDANPGDLSSNGVDSVYSAYIAGLDPASLTNRFLLSVLRSPPSVLGWNATSGRVYAIYWTSNLLNGFETPWQTNITGGVYTDTTHNADQKGFYKIDVELE